MDDDALDRLFSGNLENLPQLNKKIVRLFISSTFTDMTLERNALMEQVYPRLKKYCKEKHGLEFQVVDMRWGVRDEATDDHQTSALCSREISNCQRMSLGPNFVALLGDKYGFRPLCNMIKSEEYRCLRRCLIESDINTDLLDTWYKEDTNCLEPVYILQPISSILINFTNKMEPELQASDQRKWFTIQERLQRLLILASERLAQQHKMSQEEQLKYTLSVTEREVNQGIIEVDEPKLHCLAYLRSIERIDEQLESLAHELNFNSTPVNTLDDLLVISQSDDDSDDEVTISGNHVNDVSSNQTPGDSPTLSGLDDRLALIGKYVDLQQDGRLDEKARHALRQLKEAKVRPRMYTKAPTNICSYQLQWNDTDGVSTTTNDRYLQAMMEHFYSKMIKMIRRASKREQQTTISRSPLINEILQHSHYCLEVAKTFHGRYEELNQLRRYICSPLSINCDYDQHISTHVDHVPVMFLYGAGGSGKTSLLAKAVTLMPTWLSKRLKQANIKGDQQHDLVREPACIIVRFLGTTPASSSVITALTSICQQLQYNFYQYGQNNTTAEDKNAQPEHELELDGAIVRPQLALEPIPEDFVRLVFMFKQLLANCWHPLHRGRLFILALDSVDQLSGPTNLELKFCWILKCRLPPNVRLIISCTSPDNQKNQPGALDCSLSHNEFNFLRSSLLTQHLTLVSHLMSDGNSDGLNLAKRQSLATVSSEQHVAQHTRRKEAHISDKLSLRKLARGARHDNYVINSIKSLLMPSSYLKNNSSIQSGSNSLPDILLRQIRANMLHLKPLTTDMAMEIMEEWLRTSGRTLTEPQWETLRQALSKCGLPIYLKLAFGEISEWKSYTTTRTYTQQQPQESQQPQQPQQMQQIQQLQLPQVVLAQNYSNISDFNLPNELQEQHMQWRKQFSDHINVMNSISIQTAGTALTSANANLNQVRRAHYLSSDVQESINRLFARIELQHGYLLTKHSLSYVTAARAGISENELEDLLSMDDIVLNDVYQYHLPPVRRIPPLLWTRICNDLPNYLSERDSNGIVLQWYHKQFALVVQQRYLSNTSQANYIHSTMADYFLGKWADKAKPFYYTEAQLKLIQADTANDNLLLRGQPKADRRLPPQPLFYLSDQHYHQQQQQQLQQQQQQQQQQQVISVNSNSDSNTYASNQELSQLRYTKLLGATTNNTQQKRYNVRKLTELPYHLMKCGRYRDLFQLVLFNYKWILAKLCSSPLQSMLMDLIETSKCLASEIDRHQTQADPLSDDYNHNNESHPKSFLDINSYAVLNRQLSNRGEKHGGAEAIFVGPDKPEEAELISMVRQIKLMVDTLRLSSSILQTSPDMLAPHLLARLNPLRKDNHNYINKLLCQCDVDGCHDCALLPTDHCLQTPNGPLVCSLEDHQFAVWDFAISSDQRYILSVSNRFIMWDIATGEKSRDVSPNIEGLMMQLKITSDDEFALAYTNLNVVVVMSILTQMVKVLDLNGLIDSHDAQLDRLNGDEERAQNTKKNKLREKYKIRGLHLLDSGKDRFVVWTEAHWLVLNINNETIISGNIESKELNGTEIQLESVESLESIIEKRCNLNMVPVISGGGECRNEEDMVDLNRNNYEILEVRQRTSESLTKAHRNKQTKQKNSKYKNTEHVSSKETCNSNNDDQRQVYCDIIVLTLQNRINKSLWVQTIESVDNLITSNRTITSMCKIWPQALMVSSGIVLNTRLDRIFYSDQNNGQVVMRRLRQTGWSRPKLIWHNQQTNGRLNKIEPTSLESDEVTLAPHDTNENYSMEQIGCETGANERRASYFGYDLAQQISQMSQTKHVETHSDEKSSKSELYARLPLTLDLIEIPDSNYNSGRDLNNNVNHYAIDFSNNKLDHTKRQILKEFYQNDNNKQLTTTDEQLGQMSNKRISFVMIIYYINKFVVIYLGDEAKKGPHDKHMSCRWRHHSLYLPANERNISIKPNKCLTKFQLLCSSSAPIKLVRSSSGCVPRCDYAVGAIRKSIFLWSLISADHTGSGWEGSHLLKRFDAHYGRILHIKQLNQFDLTLTHFYQAHRSQSWQGGSSEMAPETGDRRIIGDILVASASMDKTVKIWNLANVFEESHNIRRLSMPIELVSVAKQRTLVAGLTSKEIGVWDWRTIKLLAIFCPSQQTDGGSFVDSLFTTLRLSSNGVFLATGEWSMVGSHQQQQHHVALWNVDLLIDSTALNNSDGASRGVFDGAAIDKQQNNEYQAGLIFQISVPGLVRKLRFFSQDSRLLIVSESDVQLMDEQMEESGAAGHTNTTTTTTSDLESPQKEASGNGNPSASSSSKLVKKIVVQIRQVPDGKLLYEFDYLTSTFSRQQQQQTSSFNWMQHQDQSSFSDSKTILSSSLYSGNTGDNRRRHHHRNVMRRSKSTTSTSNAYQAVRLPIMTKDQQYLVSVALAVNDKQQQVHPIGDGYILDEQMRRRRQSSVIQRPPIVLNVHSSRDGYLLRSIQINHQQQQPQQRPLPSQHVSNRLLQVPSGATIVADQLNMLADNQLTKLKSLTLYRDNRSSVVALLDDERGTSCLVDIYTKQLLAQFNNWSGKITKDGRYGLSWLSLSSSASSIIQRARESTQSSSGLELLEMRHCSSIKMLLSRSQLSTISTGEPHHQHSYAATGSIGNRIKFCGFIGANDQYVYLLMSISPQSTSTAGTTSNNGNSNGLLLLIRVRDGQILARYRPFSEVTNIRASSDRFALVLACLDGSITSLMVADPQKVETSAKLAQLPSRQSAKCDH